MIKEALQYLLGLAEKDVITVADRSYTPKNLKAIKDPEAPTLIIHTLTGIVNYIKDNFDDFSNEDIFLHILDHSNVFLYSNTYGDWKQRDLYIQAELPKMNIFHFNDWYDCDKFIIELQSKFVQDDVTKEILSVVGNITDESVKNINDDGITQNVNIRQGDAIKNIKGWIAKELPSITIIA